MAKHSDEAYVYAFTNIVNGKVYKGSRGAYSGTAEEDFRNVYNSSSCNSAFWEDLQKGELVWEIILIVQAPYREAYDKAWSIEQLLIRDDWEQLGKDMSYNLQWHDPFNGEQHFSGTWTEEQKLEIGVRSKKWWDEHPEVRELFSERNSGENNPNYGKHPSEETRSKLSDSHKGERNPNYGKPRTAETKAKISASYPVEKCPFYGQKPPKFLWLLPDGSTRIMDKGNVTRHHHYDWILIGPVTNEQTN